VGLAMAMLWEAARLAALPATMSARACMWTASCGWQVLVAPLPRLTSQPDIVVAKEHTSIVTADVPDAWRFLRLSYWQDALNKGFDHIRNLATVAFRLILVVVLACILYVLPICGTSLYAPVHLLPQRHGAESLGEVEVGHWAMSLMANSVVVDVDLELTVPNSQFSFVQSTEAARVDLQLARKQVSRLLVLPRVSAAAQQLRELLWVLPMALGLCYDEQVVRLSLATGLQPQDLVHTSPANSTSAPDLLGLAMLSSANGGIAQLRLTPALVVRTAQLQLRPRFAGPLGRPLSSFFGFVPICACLLYLGRYGRSAAPSPHDQTVAHRGSSTAVASKGRRPQITFVEVQMLAKALSGSFTGNFSATLEAFEAEDRTAHGGQLQGEVKLDRLPMITGSAEHEWRVNWDEWQLRNIIGTTLALPPTEGGLVSPGGCLQYRLWLAVTTVSLLCGDRKFADYADWLVRHKQTTADLYGSKPSHIGRSQSD